MAVIVPEVRYYEVEQTRCVKVAANNEIDALVVANQAFATNSQTDLVRFPGDRRGATVGDIEVTNVNITREQ